MNQIELLLWSNYQANTKVNRETKRTERNQCRTSCTIMLRWWKDVVSSLQDNGNRSMLYRLGTFDTTRQEW